ncbi:gamma-glutamyltransferase, partial [Saccharopolyspora sp. WRP15-2]
MPARPARLTLAVLASGALIAPMAQAAPGGPPEPPKQAEAVGYGGAVSSVDPNATQAGIDVLRRGGNATDAAVAVAAALGVTEPYSAGFGGGGYFVHYDAKTGEVETIDGRETAPASADENLFLEDGKPIPFDEAVTSGLGVGVPGTPMTWQNALQKWGSKDLAEVLSPAEQLASKGFVVDETFRKQTADNEERFRAFPATRDLFLPGGKLPEVGSVLRNPDLAATYRELGKRGADVLYNGEIGADVVRTVNQPPVDPAAKIKARPGDMTAEDLSAYRAFEQDPTHVSYRGLDVYGMAPGSSGGTTVGEALNILESSDLSAADKTQYLHRYLEASKIGFADRNRWVGDPKFSEVPTEALLDQGFADSRACLISDDAVLPTPLKAADPKLPQESQSRPTDGGGPY